MAKEYGHVYHHAGGGCQVGKMACAVCRENIDSDTEDWLETKKEIDYDWGYISRHRVCVKDKSGWLRIEKENARHEKEVDILKNARSPELVDIMQAALGDDFKEEWKTEKGRKRITELFDDAIDKLANRAFNKGREYERTN